MSKKQQIIITAGPSQLHFNIDDADFNRFLNEQTPADKLTPAFNLMSRCIEDKDRDSFKKIVLAKDGITPRGVLLMQMGGIIAEQFGGDLEISLKKQ